MNDPSGRRTRGPGGFRRAAVLLGEDIRRGGESRGFAVSRLLTHWSEIVGEDLAKQCRPVKVSYAQGGLGGTLTLLVRGAEAPMIQAQLPSIRERVNACYGYSAIARIRLTQTAPTGFAEGQADFDAAPRRAAAPQPEPAAQKRAREAVSGIADPGLRSALEHLGANILSRAGTDEADQ